MPVYGTPPDGGQMPYVSTMHISVAPTAVTQTANTVYLVRFRVARAISVNQASVLIGTASGNIDIGVWSSDGTTLTLLASTGSTAAAGSNTTQTIALTSAVTLQPGTDYYVGVAPDNATVTLGRAAPNAALAALEKRCLSKASAFPLATNAATMAISSTSGTGQVLFIFLNHS